MEIYKANSSILAGFANPPAIRLPKAAAQANLIPIASLGQSKTPKSFNLIL